MKKIYTFNLKSEIIFTNKKKVVVFLLIALFCNIQYYNSQVTFSWARGISGGSAAQTLGNAITVDLSGNVITGGHFSGSPTDFDPGAGVFNLTNSTARSLFISKLDAAGNFVWAKAFDDFNGINDINGMGTDASGNVYATGVFENSGDFDPGAGVFNMTATGQEVFVIKLDVNGNFVWAKKFGGAIGKLARGWSLSLDNSANLYIAGQFQSTADFDPSAGVFNMTATNTAGFIEKLDANGNFIWAKCIGSTGVQAQCSYVDNSGNVFVGGTQSGASQDFDPGAGVFTITSGGAFFIKLNSAGNFVFAVNYNGASDMNGIKTDANGNIYTICCPAGLTDFDPGASTALWSNGSILDKLDASGNYLWSARVPAQMSSVFSLLVLDNNGNPWITGYFGGGTFDFDPGAGVFNLTSAANSVFICNFNSSGNFVWAGMLGNGDRSSITKDNLGSIHLTGSYLASSDFDPNAGTFNLNYAGGGATDLFIAKYALCTIAPAAPSTISGNATICQSSSNTYSVAAVSGAAYYTWTMPSGWTGTSTTNTISLVASSTSGNITVSCGNACGTSALQTLSVTVNPLPSTPGSISGITTICSGSSNTYSVTSVAGATSYNWVYPGGWSGASTTNIINTTASATSGNITVSASNACGTSALQTLSVTVTPTLGTPGAISGNITICSGASNTYSIAAMVGATSYNWSLPSGWTGSSSTNIINTTASATSGNVTVTATNTCGTSSVQTLSVTVNSIPATPGAISGNNPICSGSANTYSVASVLGATSYNWAKPAGWAGASTTNIINTTASATSGNITVSASNACGTSAVQTLSVTVNVTPATPGAISGNITICSGSSNTYSVAAVAGASSYNWVYPGGWSGASTTNIINTTASATSGNITVSASNACGTSAIKTLSVTVNSIPATPGAISGLATLCSGAAASNYSVASVAGATSYTWSLAGGWSGASSTNIISATPGSSGIFTVTASNSCGMSTQQTLSVTVNPLPTISVNSGSICSGQTFTMAPSGANTYTFQGGSATVSPGSTTSYTVTGTSAQGCVSPSPATSNVTVSATPTISVAGGAICPGNSFTLSPSGASTYTFSSGPVVSPSSTTSYTITGTSSAGCVSSSPAVATVTVASSLTVTISGSTVVCNGSAVNLTAGGATTYTWNTSATTNSISPTPSVNTTYSVIGASGSCSNTAMFSVTVNPTPTITAVTSTSLICVGQSATLTASGASTYTFNPGGAGSSIVVSPTVTATYTVTGTDLNGCTNVSTITQNVSGCVGIDQLSLLNTEINVYPNPNNGSFTIQSTSNKIILLTNELGQVVKTIELNDTNNHTSTINNLPAGIYFIGGLNATRSKIVVLE